MYVVENEKKNKINEVGPLFYFTFLSLLFHSSLSADLSAHMRLPCVTDLLNKLKKKRNTIPDICSPFGCLFAWLLTNIWNVLFAFHKTPMSFRRSPYLF